MGWVRTLAVIVSLILVACFFLPYSSLTEESKTMLDTAYALYSDEEMETAAIEQEGPIIESRDGSLSVFEMTTWYFERLKEEGSAWMTVFPAAIGLLAVLALLCSIGRKPVLLFLLSAGMFFHSRGFIRRMFDGTLSSYAWDAAIAQTIYPIASAVLAVLAIVMFIVKRREKKVLSQHE